MGALAALARSAFVRSAAGTGLALAGASFLGGGDGVDPVTGLIHVGGHRRRRRRRRALTASDRADIGFIAGLLGPKAGSNFALIIGART